MPIADVSFYDVVKWFHISAVVVGFGGTFAYAVIIVAAQRVAPRSMPGVFAGLAANDRTLVTIGAIAVLLSGFYLVADGNWQMSEFFIGWGIVAIIALLGLIHAFFIPNEVKAKEAAERDIERAGSGEVEFSDEFNETNSKLGKVGPIAGLLILLTVYVMTTKPFL